MFVRFLEDQIRFADTSVGPVLAPPCGSELRGIHETRAGRRTNFSIVRANAAEPGLGSAATPGDTMSVPESAGSVGRTRRNVEFVSRTSSGRPALTIWLWASARDQHTGPRRRTTAQRYGATTPEPGRR